ncbi:segregation and condensation protein A [Solemya velum gill symbiont]|uniref:Segregation and condensation protein A n=1 Tax=Solemya velum gill symbiont TaxID=2340 RepID=A0A0B0HCS2_SOVGS|nr:ScpA family protein [Solemya velum gill symbiont]KHF25709.1 condensin, subunit ScpA [Solemya velum gill symbiont]OOY35693.1 segregation/condensation protein A [Solemya velum gill symbiont]OOY38321.1 segregation/condensation protein A [Solemya velum gill symbiont]OOY40762.1 segregation/condensation protein A [Solemya velum gill symbiont]OOY42766.1 segregation/condensation protein A [Solemya velum gill symbiont]
MEQEELQVTTQPQQQEMPFAVVQGEPMLELPGDLYIPPDALEVILEAFEGPLDLLLYLIKRQNLDILNIPIADITAQYINYIAMMQTLRLELAAEYLVMAAMLAEIKSRMLLPRVNVEDDSEDDPRAELIRRLQEYERFKQAAEDIEELPRMGRDHYQTEVADPYKHIERPLPDVDLKEVLVAFYDVLRRADMFTSHQIEKETLSMRERMSIVLEKARADQFTSFSEFFDISEGRMGVVVTFMAILELIKEQLLELVQSDNYAPIHVKARSSHVE